MRTSSTTAACRVGATAAGTPVEGGQKGNGRSQHAVCDMSVGGGSQVVASFFLQAVKADKKAHVGPQKQSQPRVSSRRSSESFVAAVWE